MDTPKINNNRLNGARQLFGAENDVSDSLVSSTTQGLTATKERREPPQPPPPLAPLSNSKGKQIRIENEDSDSIGNNSLASSTGLGNIGLGGISSTEDGENSLTSFEGILLNGIPSIDNPLNEDSNSKDSLKSGLNISKNKPLMLADLLEKKVEKELPTLNGAIGKELRIGEKGLELVENHIDQALKLKDESESKENIGVNDGINLNDGGIKLELNDKMELKAGGVKMDLNAGKMDLKIDLNPGKMEMNSVKAEMNSIKMESSVGSKMELDGSIKLEEDIKQGVKRSASDDGEFESKKPHLAVNNINGNADSPAPDSVSSSNGDNEVTGTVSTAAAKLFADIAADILEEEDEEELMQQEVTPAVEEQPNGTQIVQNNTIPQVIIDGNQQVIVSQPRIIVSQSQIATSNQVVFTGGTQMKTQSGQTVIVNSQQRGPMVLQQTNTGQLILPQGQLQLVASPGAGGQYVLQTGGAQGTYVVAQSQTAVVHGQPQTVLVAQTPQQQGTGAKTIIILQQQPASNAATHHQKVMVTPQGQQVVVTQVQRPILQQSTVSNNVPTTVIKTTGSTVQTNSNCNTEKKVEEPKPAPKPKIIRDLTNPYVCEWSDCNM